MVPPQEKDCVVQMPETSKNQKLANAALKLAIHSRQYNIVNAMNVALNKAQKAHIKSGRKGPGPTFTHIYRAALKSF
jgi:hypothetical protein